MAFFFSLGSAFFFGAGDFAGGFVSRRVPPLQVVVASQWTGLILLAAPFTVFGSDPTANGLVWGAASGVSTSVGLVFLFRALSAGAMALGAATSGVVTAAVPVLFGLATGDRPASLAMVGMALSLGAIPLIVFTRSEAEEPGRGPDGSGLAARGRLGVLDGVMAGIGLGSTSILFAETTTADGLWPIASAQSATVVLLTIVALATRIGVVPKRDARIPSMTVGALHLLGVTFLVAAVQRGLLTLVAVVQSLYPAVTIILARTILHERLTRLQVVGLLAAGAGVTLIGIS